MYGLPSNIDFGFLAGKILLQICFGENDVIFNFHDHVSISVTSAIGLTLPEGKNHKWEDFRQGAGFLVALISQTVTSVKGTADGTLSMKFKEGGVLNIYDNSKQYESYIITNGDKKIVV